MRSCALQCSWMKDGKTLKLGGRYEIVYTLGICSLEVAACEPSDAGKYTCVAENSQGTEECMCKVIVNGKRTISTFGFNCLTRIYFCRSLLSAMPIIYLLENWTDLDKTWQRDAEWGRSDSVKFWARSPQKPKRQGQNTSLFLVMNTSTTHPFGHVGRLDFTDFRKTWHEHVNPCADESFHSEILIFFPLRVAFLKKLIFC